MLGLAEGVMSLIGKALPDNSPLTDQKKIELQEDIVKLLSSADTSQAQTTLTDAQSHTFFRYGWRDLLAWGCTGTWLYIYLVLPIINYVLVRYGLPPLPSFDSSQLDSLLFSLLGLGGLHAYENINTSNNSDQNSSDN